MSATLANPMRWVVLVAVILVLYTKYERNSENSGRQSLASADHVSAHGNRHHDMRTRRMMLGEKAPATPVAVDFAKAKELAQSVLSLIRAR